MTDDNVDIRQSILLLEDDLPLAEMLRSSLESNGFIVETVENGADGIRKILEKEFNLIICDMVMPHLPGDMFYTAVSRINPDLCRRFIFMTGFTADPKYDAFIRKVNGTMLWKPFPVSDLLNVIKIKLHKKPPTQLTSKQTRFVNVSLDCAAVLPKRQLPRI